MIKLSDYIFKFLENNNVKDVFMLSGGGCMHLVDSLGKSNIRYVCNHHEQACAMAAEAYAKYTNTLGVALVTAGPGGTNAITGVVGAYQDSVPCLFISGQAKRKQTIYNSGIASLRQFGAQEVNIIPIVESITKYSVMVNEPEKIRYYLEKAIYLAKSGRPGPVWIDVPLDVQAMQIDENNLESFNPDEYLINYKIKPFDNEVEYLIEQLEKSKRPVLICGGGIKTAGAQNELIKFIEKIKIPVITPFMGVGVLYTDHPSSIGGIGTKGTRAGNFAVQNADLIISLGSRLSVSSVGHEYDLFARDAKIIVVDIDPVEHEKKTIRIDKFINCDVKLLLEKLNETIKQDNKISDSWLNICINWKRKYPVCLEEYKNSENGVNLYHFVDVLTRSLNYTIPIVSDAGANHVVFPQAMHVKKNQSYITSGALATMGFSLPAAIGVSIAMNSQPVVGITGDGSFQQNIQELQTIKHYDLPVKLFVINNNGYLSIRNTQRKFFNGRLFGCDPASGVSFPSIEKIANAYDIDYYSINNSTDLINNIKSIISSKGPFICEVKSIADQELAPTTSTIIKPDGTMVSKPMEDMYPFLDRDEFKANMIIKTVEEE